jgi:hypothetical protein
MRTDGHEGARDDYRDYAKAPKNWYLRHTLPRRSLRAVSKPSALKVVKTPELTHLRPCFVWIPLVSRAERT